MPRLTEIDKATLTMYLIRMLSASKQERVTLAHKVDQHFELKSWQIREQFEGLKK